MASRPRFYICAPYVLKTYNVALQPRRARFLDLSQDDTRAVGCKRLLGARASCQARLALQPLVGAG